VAIPWQEDRLKISNNYEMAFKRLQKLEKHLQINPEIAVAYEDGIRMHIQKGYIRRVEHAEEQPIVRWYLPHFPVVRMDRTATKTPCGV